MLECFKYLKYNSYRFLAFHRCMLPSLLLSAEDSLAVSSSYKFSKFRWFFFVLNKLESLLILGGAIFGFRINQFLEITISRTIFFADNFDSKLICVGCVFCGWPIDCGIFAFVDKINKFHFRYVQSRLSHKEDFYAITTSVDIINIL